MYIQFYLPHICTTDCDMFAIILLRSEIILIIHIDATLIFYDGMSTKTALLLYMNQVRVIFHRVI